MRHLLTLWLISAIVYGVWVVLPKDQRATVKKFAGQHVPFILAGIFVGLGLLVAAFYFGSTKLL